MATTFLPPPVYAEPITVDEQTGKATFNPIWLNWFLQAAQYLTGGSIDHNSLAGLQGGAAAERYHMTAANDTALSGARTLKGVAAADDVVILDNTKGLVLLDTRAPPHYWRVSVSNTGVLTTADLGTTPP